ncbi:hypothetical protein BU17DRAFT_90349 [Hysterangium stoloniferum]|nr:hypothetical protein BU17DRAFT_90349 [Hysterangium stoloniferum]
MNRLLTLFLALSLIFTVVVDVDAHIDTPRARNVSPHRMIKKRQVIGDLLPGEKASPQNVAASPGGSSLTDTATGVPSPVPSGVTPSSVTPVVKPQPTIISTSSTGNILSSILNLGSTTSPRPSASSPPPVSSTLSSSSPTSSTTPTTLLSSDTSPTLPTSTSSFGPNVVTITSAAPAEESSPSAAPPPSSSTKITRNTIIILAAIGGSIAAAGVIWTIIRKWKFRPSSSFEDRMQPIDWQPTHEDRDITEKLNRTASVRSHGSFTSGNGHTHSSGGHGAGGGDGLIADLPPLDYPAGPAHLAPIGGYADLHRGASPQPDFAHPVRAASPYQYDIPNPHQAPPALAPGAGYGQAPAQYYGGGAGGGAGGYQGQGQGGYEQYPQQGGYEQRGY